MRKTKFEVRMSSAKLSVEIEGSLPQLLLSVANFGGNLVVQTTLCAVCGFRLQIVRKPQTSLEGGLVCATRMLHFDIRTSNVVLRISSLELQTSQLPEIIYNLSP